MQRRRWRRREVRDDVVPLPGHLGFLQNVLDLAIHGMPPGDRKRRERMNATVAERPVPEEVSPFIRRSQRPEAVGSRGEMKRFVTGWPAASFQARPCGQQGGQNGMS